MNQNSIITLGNKNVQLQNISARDIKIISGTEIDPEIVDEKKKLAQEIADLVQIVSLKKTKNTKEEKSLEIDETKFESIDFEDLLKAIQFKNCILFIGPELSLDEKGQNIHREFYKKISDKKRKFNVEDDFFMPGSETRLINISKDFYQNQFEELNKIANFTLKQIAQIPFHLIISLSPDDSLHRIFNNYNIKHQFLYYTGVKQQDEKIQPDEKIVYNALGAASKNGRYIYTHKQYSQYLKNDIEAKFPFEIENKIKNEETTHYLFLGFDFNKWYYKLLMYELNLTSDAESFTFENNKTNEINKEFIEKQFHISFINSDYQDFINTLFAKCKKNGLIKSLDETFTNSLLEELENIRIKAFDEISLGNLKALNNELQLIKNKINI